MANIHPTAIIEPGAKIAATANIGPYCIVGAEVELGENVTLVSHVVVAGRTTIGDGTKVWPFASLGHQPQDLKFKGESSVLIIGKNNMIREHVTMNPGTEGGGLETRVGDNCLFMMSTHVAHDCQVGNNVILANNATLAGHVTVGDFAVLGGLCAVHQFVRIGRHVMVGGMTGVENDVIPYGSVTGNRARLAGLNLVGIKRRGFDRETIHAIRNAYKELFAAEGALSERVEAVASKYAQIEPVMEMVEFIRADASRSICTPKSVDGD